MLISVTRLHLRSRRFLLPFLLYTFRSSLQLRRSRGFRGGMLGGDPQRGNWTITGWDSEAELRAFRNGGAHAVAMRKLLEWCDEASYTHYESSEDDLPAADVAYARLADGRISKVNQPSAAHAAGRTVSDWRPRFNLPLKPRQG